MSQQPSKLRNPTAYHLMMSSTTDHQQQLINPAVLDEYSPLHEFDDLNYGRHQQQPSLVLSHHKMATINEYGFGGEESPSEGYDTTTESSPPPNNTDYSMAFFSGQFPMSAPAELGFYAGHHHMNPWTLQASPPGSLEDEYTLQMNLQAMMEKRRRRRESHNAVERRRRENINERIQELGQLLPEQMLEDGTGNKLNKGAILRKSVDHIRLLQQDVTMYQNRIRELEETLAKILQEQKFHQQ